MIRRPALIAEGLGSALLLATIVGSGIMGSRLSGGNTAIALLANSLATGGMLVVLISLFAPLSGAHFNPVVTLAAWADGQMKPSGAAQYIAAQMAGSIAGVWLAHAMFGQPILEVSMTVRSGPALWLSEAIATFGLLVIIHLGRTSARNWLPALIALYILAAYWFTASTSFANPAVTLARALTESFAGIRPMDVPSFILAQIAGTFLALLTCRLLKEPHI